MPIYEYLCKKCGHRFEEIKKFSDKQPTKCPKCGGALEQVITAAAVQFKGSGWYVTDYAKKGSSATGTASSSNSSDGEGSSKQSGESKDSKDSKESKDTKESTTSKKDDKPKSESSSKKQKKE